MAQSYRPTPHRRWLVIGVIAGIVVIGLIAYFAFAGGGYSYGGNDGDVGRGYALVDLRRGGSLDLATPQGFASSVSKIRHPPFRNGRR